MHKSQRKNDILEERLKSSDERGGETSFRDLKRKYKRNAALVKILEENCLTFQAKLPKGIRPARSVELRIETYSESKPPSRRLYRLSSPEILIAKSCTTKNLDAGKIRPGRSPYVCLKCFPKKKESSLSVVVDCWRLN